MKLKILEHDYENTGGHCMVGITTVYDEESNRTLYIMVNEEGYAINTANYLQHDIEWSDKMPVEACNWDIIDDTHHIFDTLRRCRIQYIIDECKDGSTDKLEWMWLDEELRALVSPHYHEWIDEQQDGLFETNGYKIYTHLYYEAPPVEDDPDIIACQSLLDYMNEAMNKGMNGPNSTPEEQEALDAAAEEFYSKKIILGFDERVIVLGVGAAEFTGLQECLQYIIDQR